MAASATATGKTKAHPSDYWVLFATISAYFKGDRHGWGIGIWSAFTLLTSGLGPFIGGVLS